MNELFDFLIKKDVEYKREESISNYTSVRIGGPAAVIAFPDTQEKFVELVAFLLKSNIAHKVIGRMTNILPCDDRYDGVIVSTKLLGRYEKNDTVINAECGVPLSLLIMQMARLGLGGLEPLYGIPGSVGGMIVSNAGAYGSSLGDAVKSVCAYSLNKERVITLMHDEMDFSYRRSIFYGSDMLVLSAELEFVPCEPDIIVGKLGMIKQRRASSQPLESPSLGSVFKRVGDISAGQIIDQCGLKGLKVGGAEVSCRHAGFMINTGNATATEYRQLVEIVEREVYKQRAVTLEREIEFL